MNIDQTVNSFATAMGNGAAMGKLFKQAVDYVVETRDTTIILRMIQRAEKRGDKAAASLVRFTFGKVFTGAKVNTKAGNIVGIKIAGSDVSNSAMAALHDLVTDGASMRGTKWKAAFATEVEKPAFDLQAFVARALKAHPEVSKAVFAAAFQAA